MVPVQPIYCLWFRTLLNSKWKAFHTRIHAIALSYTRIIIHCLPLQCNRDILQISRISLTCFELLLSEFNLIGYLCHVRYFTYYYYCTLCYNHVIKPDYMKQNKQTNSMVWVRERTYRPSDRRLSAKWLPTFADKGCHVVSVTDPYGRILGFLDRSRYFSIK
jgi:hypothetical protein